MCRPVLSALRSFSMVCVIVCLGQLRRHLQWLCSPEITAHSALKWSVRKSDLAFDSQCQGNNYPGNNDPGIERVKNCIRVYQSMPFWDKKIADFLGRVKCEVNRSWRLNCMLSSMSCWTLGPCSFLLMFYYHLLFVYFCIYFFFYFNNFMLTVLLVECV